MMLSGLAASRSVQKLFRLVCLAVILFTCAERFVLGQTETASIGGRVTDASGLVLPEANVEINNVETNVRETTKTNRDGLYLFPSLKPGHYVLTVGKPGFKTVNLIGLTLYTQDKVSRNFNLPVGAVSESVTVTATGGMAPISDSPAVGVLVNRDFVENMPLNGRSFQDLIALAPGAVASSGANGNSLSLGLFSINGQREDANYYTVDGVAANLNANAPSVSPGQGLAGTLPAQTVLGTTQSLASVDDLQEFKIQTSTYTAEFGRQPGGQVSLTTRSGTNDLHGSAFDYFRNDVLDANSWLLAHTSTPKRPEHQNDFGGTIGGALKIPLIYKGNRTFYFVSYEALRLILPVPGGTGITNVPTPAYRQFAAPGVRAFLNATPLPTGPDNGDACAASLGFSFSCTARFFAPLSTRNKVDSVSVRLDQAIGSRVQLFVRYSDVPSVNILHNIAETDPTTSNIHTWTLGAAVRVRDNLLTELRFNYSSSYGTVQQTPISVGGAVPYPQTLLMPPQFTSPGTTAQGTINYAVPNANFFYIPTYSKTENRVNQYNVLGSLSWTRSNHALKLGADERRLASLFGPFQYLSEFFFLSVGGIQQGFVDQAAISAQRKAQPTFTNLSLYAEDHWKVLPRLSLDYGVRWEFNPPPGASDGLYPLALTTSDLTTAQLAPQGTKQYRSRHYNFAPRFGFAFNAISSETHSLVVRGGGGLFYDTGQALGSQGYNGYPFTASESLTNVALPASATALAAPSLSAPLIPPYGFMSAADPKLALPYTEQWSLSLDQQLAVKDTLTISYVGNNGKKLLFSTFLRPVGNPAFGTNGLLFTNNGSSSTYHSLQIQNQGYIAPRLQLIGSYAWSHALDNVSSDLAFPLPVRGNSDNDVRHVVNVALNYQVPSTVEHSVLRALATGWSLDDRFIAMTGYPLDISQGNYFLANGQIAGIRPDLVKGEPIYLHGVPGIMGGWALDPAAFSPVPTNPTTGVPLREGNLGRNYVRGPAFWNLNCGVQRSFPLHDRLRLLFRAEAFNIFNHPNPGNIDTFLSDTTFGQPNGRSATVGVSGGPNSPGSEIYGTGSPRSLQLMLKLQF